MSNMNQNNSAQANTDQIKEFSYSSPSNTTNAIHCLTIAGQIEGHQSLSDEIKTTKYEHVMPLIAAIEETPSIKGLLILLNTGGGDVEAGLGIAELISGMKKPTASIVLGGGHSIGVPLAVAAKKSFIAPSAAMTIHPVRMNGLVIGVPQSFDYFQRMQKRVVNFVLDNSSISREKFTDYMLRTSELANDVGSILDAEEAVSCGLVDSIGSLSDALEYLHTEINKSSNNELQ